MKAITQIVSIFLQEKKQKKKKKESGEAWREGSGSYPLEEPKERK